MIAIIIVLIVAGALYFAWRARNKKANAPKPPEWTNAGEPPADRPDPPAKADL